MKNLLKAISVISLTAFPISSVFAADGAESSPTSMSNFSLKMKVVGRYSLLDSTRQNAMDLFSNYIRLATKYEYKNVFAIADFQSGSQGCRGSSGSTTCGTSNGTTAGQQLFFVRRAYTQLYLVKSQATQVSLVVGRDHLSSSIMYTPDGLTLLGTNFDNVSSTASEDGVSVQYRGVFDFGVVTALIGTYDNTGVAVQSAGSGFSWGTQLVGQADNTFSAFDATQSRVILGSVGTDVKVWDGVVQGRALFTYQENAPQQYPTTSSGSAANDVTNVEASLGYNYQNGALQGGAWFQSTSIGATKNCTTNCISNGNKVTYNDARLGDSENVMTIGIGAIGNSKLFGLSGLLSDGDVLTYGASYQNISGQNRSGSAYTAIGGTVVNTTGVSYNQFNIAGGYGQGLYTLELNYLYSMASEKVYPDGSNANSNLIDNASLFYLAAIVAI